MTDFGEILGVITGVRFGVEFLPILKRVGYRLLSNLVVGYFLIDYILLISTSSSSSIFKVMHDLRGLEMESFLLTYRSSLLMVYLGIP